jgi:hypothetical protein
MRTRKPCPGCGREVHSRSADKVCDDCARAILKWAEHVAKIKATPDNSMVLLKGRYHWYPMFYFGGPRQHVDELDELRADLARFFEELGERLCADVLDWPDAREEKPEALFPAPDVRKPLKRGENYAEMVSYPSSKGENSYHDKTGVIDRRNLELLRGLWDRTARFTDLAYIAGVQDGKNLLLQLATGEMSPQDFQEQDIKLGKARQNAAYLHSKLKAGRSKP